MASIDFSEWIAIVIVAIVIFFIVAWITRWIFSIPKQIKYQETIIKLLSEIALKDGVYKERVSEILDDANKSSL